MPSLSPRSKTRRTLGCVTRLESWISRLKRSRVSGSVRDVRADELQRDVAVEPLVVDAVDRPHSAHAEKALMTRYRWPISTPSGITRETGVE